MKRGLASPLVHSALATTRRRQLQLPRVVHCMENRIKGMKRSLAEGSERFELLVGAAVLANNMMNIAAWLTKRASRRYPSA